MKSLKTFLLFFISVIFSLKTADSDSSKFIQQNVTLTIQQGTLFGKKSLDFRNESYYSFEGIPFAKPPIGALRFKAPETPEPWIGIYDATQVRPICPQEFYKNMAQSEDCLFLNVYSKMTKKLKPVMVWIHGGALEMGQIFKPTKSPQFLIGEDIVLVYTAYRLSVFGYLSIEDDASFNIPGNAGFKDLVMALKWIQKNIEDFGGDPKQVTIFGQSAGAAAVHLLYLSPTAKGLFHRAIAQSGVGTNPFITSPNKYPELAKVLNCNFGNLTETVNCINETSTKDMLNAMQKLKNNTKFRTGETTVFNSLTIENKNTENIFIDDYPDNIVKQATFDNVPFMLGINSDEGGSFFDTTSIKPNFTDYESLIPKDINVTKGTVESIKLGKRIKAFYYKNKTPSYELVDQFIDYITDIKFLQKATYSAKLQATIPESKIYFYHFNYSTSLNAPHNLNTTRNLVLHSDELAYLFYNQDEIVKYSDPKSDEFIGIHRMVKLWTTFAKSKNADPNPVNDPLLDVKWLPMTKEKFNYLLIQPDLKMNVNPFSQRLQFWQDVYNEYNITEI